MALQPMIRIYAAVLDIEIDSVIPDMPEMKDSNSWFIINLKVLTVKPKQNAQNTLRPWSLLVNT